MEWIAYIYLGLFAITALFIVVALVVENNVKEETSFMKWWRKHIIGNSPDDIDI